MIKLNNDIEYISCYDCGIITCEISSNGNEYELRCNKCALEYYQKSKYYGVKLYRPKSMFNGSTI